MMYLHAILIIGYAGGAVVFTYGLIREHVDDRRDLPSGLVSMALCFAAIHCLFRIFHFIEEFISAS